MELQVVQYIPIDQLLCEPQVRERFDEESLIGLSQSIKESGILTPLLVRRDGDRFVVVDGERRFLAAKRAGLSKVASIIDDRELNPVEVTLRQLVVNTQRQGLTPIERAKAYASLIEQSGWPAAEVARRTGVSEATVSRLTTLLTLPPDVIRRVELGEIPASTAYQLAVAGDAASQLELADEVANGRMTRDGVVQKTRARRGKRIARARGSKSCDRILVPLGAGRSITVRGPRLTLDTMLSWLDELAQRISAIRTDGMELGDAVRQLAAQNGTQGGNDLNAKCVTSAVA